MEIKRVILNIIVPVMAFLCYSDLMAVRRKYGRQTRKTSEVEFLLQSSAFSDQGDIPIKYTCDGDNISPPLRWSGVPKGAQSFVLFCTEYNAIRRKLWVHWVAFNIPVSVRDLPAKANIQSLKGMVGTNSWGSAEYGGPCPPLGKHRYKFKLFALKVPKLILTSKAKRKDVKTSMKGRVLDKAVLIGKYKRRKKK